MAGRQASLSLLVPTVRVKSAGGRKAKKAKGGRAVQASFPSNAPPATEPDAALLDALRSWRRDEARSRAVPAYVVLHDKTIDAIARERPQSTADLGEIPGIGPAKLAAYGEAILKALGPTSRS
jgi:ATP-dependent DNA helicase RecQ